MIDQIIDNGPELFIDVSITSSSTTIPLKVIEMELLREYLITRLEEHNYEMKLEHIADDELVMQVAKRPAYRTIMRIDRQKHRPLEVVVNVDYGRVDEIKDVIRISRSVDYQFWTNSRWLWFVLFFMAVVAGAISILRNLIELLVSNVQLGISQEQQLLLVIVFTLLTVIIWVYVIPLISRQKSRTLHQQDQRLLSIVSHRIKEIHNDLIATDIIRCWNCFKQLDEDLLICPYCEEEQNRI